MKLYTMPDDYKSRLNKLIRETEKLLRKHKGAFECSKGCSGCCITFPWNLIEIMNIRENDKYLKLLSQLQQRVIDYHFEYHWLMANIYKSSDNFNIYAATFKHLPCVFLHSNKCLVYKDRPILCRLYASNDAKKCAGLHGLSAVYQKRANQILLKATELNARYSQLYHADNYNIQGLPFRYLLSEENRKYGYKYH